MHLALSIGLDKPGNPEDAKAMATLIKSFDKLLRMHNCEPIFWEAEECDGRGYFKAYIPADCIPDFEKASPVIDKFKESISKLS